ncbi:uncharacterized protein LOC128393342 isoform X1 [Panonychus citri]|uniref:uncharacterized protein LOC128393342 isoform X1 n=1 Tax=Panonychus citri TaxID=50023 RepID=UPI0023077078|nr:uncharacterized protein LOC128393342 isoform X1 [Panonychus citri]
MILIVNCLILCLIIVNIKSFPLINYENLDQLTYSVEPKFSFNFQFNIPLTSLFDKTKIATINLPMTITIREESDQPSEETINKEPNQSGMNTIKSIDHLKPESIRVNSKYKFPSNYPAYIPIYYEEQDDYHDEGNNLQDNQPQQSIKITNNSNKTINNQRNDYNHRRDKFSFQQRIKRNHENNPVEGVNCFSKLVCQISRAQLIDYHLIEPIVIDISRFTQLTVNNQSDHDNQQEKQLLGPLREAEQFGRLSGNCEEKYSNCN